MSFRKILSFNVHITGAAVLQLMIWCSRFPGVGDKCQHMTMIIIVNAWVCDGWDISTPRNRKYCLPILWAGCCLDDFVSSQVVLPFLYQIISRRCSSNILNVNQLLPVIHICLICVPNLWGKSRLHPCLFFLPH